MLTMLFPYTMRRPIPGLTHKVDRVLFAKTFRENNSWVRLSFFSDPLIKYLWSKIFIEDNPEIVISHLRRLKSADQIGDGEARQERLLKDMMQLELELNFKMLPDVAKNRKNLPPFSQ